MRPLALALTLLAAPAAAHEVTTETLVIDHPYALETPATALSGPGFLTITNTGAEPDRLLAVRAAFPRVVLRGPEGPVGPEGVGIAPGQTVALSPGGMHVLFMGLDGDPFEVGERIPATLVFDRAGEIAVEFWVEPRAGAGPHAAPAGRADPGDPAVAAAVRAALDRLMGDGAAAGPVALAADAAVAPWRAGGEAGRAFLRRGPEGWRVIALSGESLRLAASFRVLGLSPRQAAELEAALGRVEAAAEPSSRAAWDAFRGTLVLAGD